LEVIMSTHEALTALSLPDSARVFFKYPIKHDVSLTREFSEYYVLAQETNILDVMWDFLSIPSLRETLIDLSYDICNQSQDFAEAFPEWEDPEDVDEDDEDYEPEWDSFDSYLDAVKVVAKKYPGDVLYGILDGETVREDSKRGHIDGWFKVDASWGSVKNDPAVWAFVDSFGMEVGAKVNC
jgi:hypothetical protein